MYLNKRINIGAISALVLFCVLSSNCSPLSEKNHQRDSAPVLELDPLEAVSSRLEHRQYYVQEQPIIQNQKHIATSTVQRVQYETVASSGQQQPDQVSYEVAPEQEYYVAAQPEHPTLYRTVEQQENDQSAPDSYPQNNPQQQDQDAQVVQYPNEIFYVNGAREVQGAPEVAVDSEYAQQQQQQAELANVGSMISKNPGMPATILTEVPIKDMPLHVLEKLKKDYGVRVVATRNHPGANLMINCEQQLNGESTLCGDRRQQASYLTQLAPYSYVDPVNQAAHPAEQPANQQNPSEQFNQAPPNEAYQAVVPAGYEVAGVEEPKATEYANKPADDETHGSEGYALTNENNGQAEPSTDDNVSYGTRNVNQPEETNVEQESKTSEKQEESSGVQQDESKNQSGSDSNQQQEKE